MYPRRDDGRGGGGGGGCGGANANARRYRAQLQLTAAAAAARQTALLKADLVHNPASHEGWIALADHLAAVKDMALDDAARLVGCGEWRRSAEANTLVSRLRVAIRRACCAAVLSAESASERVAAHERAGLAAYELAQKAPPSHDVRLSLNPTPRMDGSRRAALASSLESFDAAAKNAPEEWSYPCMGAKAARKLGAPAEAIFERLAASRARAPGNLEAFYQTHASRVKTLLKIRDDPARDPGALAVVAAHVHDPNIVSAALVRGEESWDAQWEDAVEALRACGRALPGFHKAHYRVAWATLKNKPKARGAGVEANLEAMGLDRGMFWARSALSPLFKTNVQWSVARGAPPRFAVNMTEIDNRNPNPWRGPTARRTIRAEGTFKLTSVGTNESPRKFVGAVRRALRMYLCVCFAAEDLAPLAAAPAYLGDARFKFFRATEDLRLLAFGLAVRGIAAAVDALDKDKARKTRGGEGVHARDAFPDGDDDDDDDDPRDRCRELAYFIWLEMGTRVGGDEAWDRAVLAAQKEVDHESSLTGGSDDDDAPVPLLGLSFRRALEKASSLPVDAAACQTRAYSYVRELGERGDIETLIDLYHDANRRVEEATKRDAKIQSFVGGERSGVAVAKNARDAVKGELFDRFMEVARATESDRFDADTRRDAAVAAAVFYREVCETVHRLEASLRTTEEKALDAEARLADARLADARLADARLASAERFRSATPPPPAHVAHTPTHAAGLPVAYPVGMQPPAPRDPAQIKMTAARAAEARLDVRAFVAQLEAAKVALVSAKEVLIEVATAATVARAAAAADDLDADAHADARQMPDRTSPTDAREAWAVHAARRFEAEIKATRDGRRTKATAKARAAEVVEASKAKAPRVSTRLSTGGAGDEKE